MRALLSTTALILSLGTAVPVSAQMMCGSGQAGATASSGGMCAPGTTGQAPAAAPDASTPQQSSGMCPCCRNMAMMRGGQGGGGMNMPGHSMPGMEMPKAQ